MPTLADDLRQEAELLRRRFVHHTRPQRPLSMEDAKALAVSIAGPINFIGPAVERDDALKEPGSESGD